jgi:hypothetical protein
MMTDRLARNGQYGLCGDLISKRFLKRFLKTHSSSETFRTAVLLAPYAGAYMAKEQAVLDLYSTRAINVVLEDIKLEALRDVLEAEKEA